jgi:hypothetical protein
MLSVNVNNKSLSDDAFREIVRNTVAHVEGGTMEKIHSFRDGVRVYREVSDAAE